MNSAEPLPESSFSASADIQTQPVAIAANPEIKQERALGAVAAGGFAWNLASTAAAKLLGFVSQIFLARLLIPEQFGAYTQAMIVVMFSTLPRDAVISTVLVARQAEMSKWISPGFWLSLVLGALSSLAMAVCAWCFSHRPDGMLVEHLLLIAAVGSPFCALGAVPSAILQAKLRFKFLAQTATWAATLIAVAGVTMAFLGCGAYSLMVPTIAAAAGRSVILLGAAKPAVRFSPEIRLWCSFAHDGGLLLLTSICGMAVSQGDYLTISSLFDKYALGIYFFAFNLSMQAVQLASVSLSNVLLPTLAILSKEPQRQTDAFLRSSRVIAAVGIPLCVMQAVLARPLVWILYGAKWNASIPLLQILSLATGVTIVTAGATPMLQAQRRYRFMAAWSVLYSIVFLLMVQIGARTGGLLGTSVAVAIYGVVFGITGFRLTLADLGSWRDVASTMLPPTIASAIASSGLWAVLAISRVASITGGKQGKMICCVAALSLAIGFSVVYVGALRMISPTVFGELCHWSGQLVGRLKLRQRGRELILATFARRRAS